MRIQPALALLTGCAALFPLALSTAVAAQETTTLSDSLDYEVIGFTPVVCTLSLGEGGAASLLNFRAADANVYQIDQLVSTETLSTRAAAFEVTLDGVCNSAHRIRVESLNNGLWQLSQTPPSRPDGFATAVPYEVTANWSDRELRLFADAGVRELREEIVPVEQPTSGDLVLRFSISEGATNLAANAPLVAGPYVDTLTVVLEPQQ
jgi:hypothetical protein